jgi:GT2 family glycosyltransferase
MNQVAGKTTTGAETEVAVAAPRLAVVIVNWNGWADTIECLESLLRQSMRPRVIVIDNGSTDDSVARLEAWASGAEPWEPPAGPLRRLTAPPLGKPVRLARATPEEALARVPGAEEVMLIASPDNLGFSAGNNLGLRHALLDPRIAYCWCLNNDAVADPNAVKALVQRMDATHKVGMCGTQVRYYSRPGHWQALNGHRFKLLTGQSRGIGLDVPVTRPFDPKRVAQETDFVLGASLAVSRPFLETVGFMEESYFLYFEEMDWAVRNRGRFATAFAHAAIVYHKEGGSIGSSTKKGARSSLSEYYLMRSRIRFYARNFPLLLPVQYATGFGLALRRLLRRQPDKAAAMLRAMFGMNYKS